MIEPYWGEFLISPIPLEMSLHFCSHKCAYCFANLNDPNRKADVRQIMRFLSDYTQRDTLEATLLKQGYPVCISNRTDPFAYANYRQTLPILETMVNLEIPVQIQTKGGAGVDDALKFLPPSVWYISISFLDDQLRKAIEPGAPTIESRFDLIEKIRAAGGRVVLGLNPVVPEWLPDSMPLLKRAKAVGVEAVWIEELHLNSRQVANMSQAEKAAIGDDVLKRALRRRRDATDNAAFFEARENALELGFEIFSNGQPDRSGIWDIYRQVYPKTFPTNQDFVNFSHDNDLHGKLIPYEIWEAIVLPYLPEGRYRMSKYIGASAMSLWETFNIPSKLTYPDLLGIVWQSYRAKQNPARMPAYAFASLRAQNGWVQLVNQKEFPYMVFDKAGAFETYHTEVVPVWGEEAENG